MTSGVTLKGLGAWEEHVEEGIMQHRGYRYTLRVAVSF